MIFVNSKPKKTLKQLFKEIEDLTEYINEVRDDIDRTLQSIKSEEAFLAKFMEEEDKYIQKRSALINDYNSLLGLTPKAVHATRTGAPMAFPRMLYDGFECAGKRTQAN